MSFRIDIGRNRYYQFAIGKEQTKRSSGLTLIGETSYVSPLQGPLEEMMMGRTAISVPANRFTKDDNLLQLISYRTKDKTGMAVSDIMTVEPGLALPSDPLPDISFSKSVFMEQYSNTYTTVQNVPFSYKERRMSDAMFLQSILPAIQGAIRHFAPQVGNLIGGLLQNTGSSSPATTGSTAGTSGAPATGNGILTQLLNSPEVSRIIQDLMNRILQGTAHVPTAGVTRAASFSGNHYSQAKVAPLLAALPALMPLLQQVLTPETIGRVLEQPTRMIGAVTDGVEKLGRLGIASHEQDLQHLRALNPGTGPAVDGLLAAMSLSNGDRYSMAKVAPLLAALPALMPLLQQVLTPETVGRILEQPSRMIGAVTDSVEKLGRLGIDSHEQDLRHLRELNPGTGPAVDSLLASMSMAIQNHSRTAKYRRLNSVKLVFTDTATVNVEGNEKLVYLHGRDIGFPMKVETPRTIRQANVELVVKSPADNSIKLIKKFKARDFTNGEMPFVPGLVTEEAKALQPNEDYMITVSLYWKNSKGNVVGTVMSQIVRLAGRYLYGGVNGTGDAIPLNDIEKFREAWHKIWKTAFSNEKRKFSVDARYYFILEKQATTQGRMETVERTDAGGYPVKVQLKTGSILNVKYLNSLLPKISSHPMLSEEELHALDTTSFTEQFHSMARLTIDLLGRPGENAVVWVYPEVKLHEFLLRTPADVDTNGRVISFSDKSIYFPVPSSVHFIGAKSGS